MSVTIEILDSLAGLDNLAADAEADGRRMVSRFMQDWSAGTNQFNRDGECAYRAINAGQVEGICGLNQDPFAGDLKVGRVRRLYVATTGRRQGIGTALMRRLIHDAANHFRELHLRTHDAQACAFYESIGFSPMQGNPDCTYRLMVFSILNE